MAVPYSNTKLRVPKGFQNLIEGFAREVLRSQPENIYDFGAKYFEALLKRREETGVDPAEHEAALEDRFYNNKSFKQKTVDVSSEHQNEAATKIQTKYRQYAAKQEVEDRREEQAAAKIQAGFRGFKDRTRVAEMKKEQNPEGHARSMSQDNIEIPDDVRAKAKHQTMDDQMAACKIQAGFRGHKDRQRVQEMKKQKSQNQNAPSSAQGGDDAEAKTHQAASVIQAGFRGMQTRRKIKDMKDTSPRFGEDQADQGADGAEAGEEEAGGDQLVPAGGEEAVVVDEAQQQADQQNAQAQDEATAAESAAAETVTAEEQPSIVEGEPTEEVDPASGDNGDEAAEPAAE